MRIFTAGLRKLIRRPASIVSVGLLVGLLGLILIAAATVTEEGESRTARALITFPGAYDLILSFMFGLGGLVAVWSMDTLTALQPESLSIEPNPECTGG